ncbi:MAG: hypothetical protein M3295_02105 [Chloroflexota bacterium]|nr:hypothetical protein [Chloroflexota bacterium]
MKRRIRRFSVLRSATAIAVMYAILIAVFAIPVGLIGLAISAGQRSPAAVGFVFFLFAPLLYGFIAWLAFLLTFAIYNLTSRWTGGIEVDVEEERPAYGIAPTATAGWGPYGTDATQPPAPPPPGSVPR